MDDSRTRVEVALVVVLVVATVFFVRAAPNDMTRGDSFGCLLTSQAILLDGSLALDAYPKLANPDNYQYDVHNGHVFYALGFGTSLLSVPAVWIAHRLGLDMVKSGDDAAVQRIMAALIVGALLFVIWLSARLLLPPVWAGCFALAAVLGTSLCSTLGTALWNMGFETVGIFAAMFLIVRHAVRGAPLRPFLVGLLLGLALFSRPTASLAVGVGSVYVLAASPRGIWKYVLGVGCWIVVLGTISRLSYGLWIPPYYRAVGMELTWRPDIVLQGLLATLGLIGICIHAGQGLTNPETMLWSSRPNVDPTVRYVFDWRFSQILATPRQRLDRRVDMDLLCLGLLPAGEWAGVDLPAPVRYYGWSPPTAGSGSERLRSSRETTQYVVMALAETSADSLTCEVSLAISPGATVAVRWNGVPVGTIGPGDGSFARCAIAVGPDALASPRHRGTTYPLVPKPLRIPYDGRTAHEIAFRIAGNAATGNWRLRSDDAIDV